MDNRLLTAQDVAWLRRYFKWPLYVVGFMVGIIVLASIWQVVKPVSAQVFTDPVIPAYQVPDQILTMANQLGLNQQYLVDAKAQIGTATNCPQEAQVVACYDPNTSIIYVLPSAFTDGSLEANSSLAHEYLHYIYQHVMSEQDHANLTLAGQRTYDTNSVFRERMQPYVDRGILPGSETFGNEAFAINCTEMSDREMTPSWLTMCSHWIPNRAALPSDF